MKCEDAEREFIVYLGGLGNRADRVRVDEHLATCPACRAKAEEFRSLSNVLDELPGLEPSFGFDARLRAAVAAEPDRGWFTRLPQLRLALSVAFLVALSVWVAKMEPLRLGPSITPVASSAQQQEDFNAIKDLGVLENYDVVTKMDALSELAPSQPPDPQGTQALRNAVGTSNDGGA
jgi:anti-sigma factor RsiW